jgi:hypothetical protein
MRSGARFVRKDFFTVSCWQTHSTCVILTLMKRVDSCCFPITCAPSRKRRLRTTRANVFASIKLSISKTNFHVRITHPQKTGAKAVLTEIRTVLLPAIIGLDPQPGEQIDEASDSARRVAIEMRLTLSIIQTREFFEHELDQLERLDARIIRLVKNLVQIKAMKQMLR